jgi:hypothetical protein
LFKQRFLKVLHSPSNGRESLQNTLLSETVNYTSTIILFLSANNYRAISVKEKQDLQADLQEMQGYMLHHLENMPETSFGKGTRNASSRSSSPSLSRSSSSDDCLDYVPSLPLPTTTTSSNRHDSFTIRPFSTDQQRKMIRISSNLSSPPPSTTKTELVNVRPDVDKLKELYLLQCKIQSSLIDRNELV